MIRVDCIPIPKPPPSQHPRSTPRNRKETACILIQGGVNRQAGPRLRPRGSWDPVERPLGVVLPPCAVSRAFCAVLRQRWAVLEASWGPCWRP
eukprot:5023222-Pyramimonas_sp.AAC.1